MIIIAWIWLIAGISMGFSSLIDTFRKPSMEERIGNFVGLILYGLIIYFMLVYLHIVK